MEVKHLNSSFGPSVNPSRIRARSKVEEQMRKAMHAWSQRHSDDEVYGAVYTGENHRQMGDSQDDKKIDLGYLSKPVFKVA
jgi:hypothetical protein